MTFADGDGACRRLTNSEVVTSFVPTIATVRLTGARGSACTIRGSNSTGSSPRFVAAAHRFASRSSRSGCPCGSSCISCASVVSRLAGGTVISDKAGSAAANVAVSVASAFRGKKSCRGSHDLQEDLGIGHDCRVGGNKLDCQLGLTARATTGQDELQIANSSRSSFQPVSPNDRPLDNVAPCGSPVTVMVLSAGTASVPSGAIGKKRRYRPSLRARQAPSALGTA